jgi:hypothetical protein
LGKAQRYPTSGMLKMMGIAMLHPSYANSIHKNVSIQILPCEGVRKD